MHVPCSELPSVELRIGEFGTKFGTNFRAREERLRGAAQGPLCMESDTLAARYWVAMSEENVELVRKSIDAFNRGDLDAWMGFLSPDVVWESQDVRGITPVYRGRAGAREWLEQFRELFEEIRLEIEQITALGDDRVLSGYTEIGRGRGSGEPMEQTVWSILWVAEGLITRRQGFPTREKALEAAGLSE
jgi:ketosteroid isomerase-like protein